MKKKRAIFLFTFSIFYSSLSQEIIDNPQDSLQIEIQTNSKYNLNRKHINAMSINELENLFSTLAPVTKIENKSQIYVRGGGYLDHTVYLNNLPLTNPLSGRLNFYLPNNYLNSILLETGTFGVHHGNTLSGVLTMRTTQPTDRIHGSVDLTGDGFLSQTKAKLGTYSYGYSEYNARIHSPLINKNWGTFNLYFSKRNMQDHLPSWGWTHNNNRPQAFTEVTIPANGGNELNFYSNATFNINKSLKLTADFLKSEHKKSVSNPLWIYNPDHAPERESKTTGAALSLKTQLHPQLQSNLHYSYYDTFERYYDRFFGDNLQEYGDPRFNPLDENDNYNYGTQYTARIFPDYYAPDAQFNTYGKQHLTSHMIKGDFNSDIITDHDLSFGIEYQYYSVRSYTVDSPVKLSTKGVTPQIVKPMAAGVSFYGYDIEGNEVEDGDFFTDIRRDEAGLLENTTLKQAPYRPYRFGVYLEDNFRFESFFVSAGIRYDLFNANSWQFKELEARYDQEGNYIPGTGMFGGDAKLDPEDVEESKTFHSFSPRVSISYHLSTRSLIHAGYGQFIRMPYFKDLYLSPFYVDSYAQRGGYFSFLNNPALEPIRNRNLELGFRHHFKSGITLSAAVYQRDTSKLPRYQSVQSDLTFVAMHCSDQEINAKGFNFNVELPITKNIHLWSDYSFQKVNKGFYTISYSGSEKHDDKSADYQQNHYLTAAFEYRLFKGESIKIAGIYPFEGSSVSLNYTYSTGTPYIKHIIYNTIPFTGSYDPNVDSETSINFQEERTPAINRFDLKISKSFPISYFQSSLDIYCIILNLFDRENVTGVWTTTGKPDDTGFRSTTAGQEYWSLASKEEKQRFLTREMDYLLYGMPRQIRLGVRLVF